MIPVDLLPEAGRDFDESFDWYAECSANAAARFAAAVDEALRVVASDPERFAVVAPRHRACRVQGFPFRVIYRIEPECVVVVAIAHAKRRPAYWKGRR